MLYRSNVHSCIKIHEETTNIYQRPLHALVPISVSVSWWCVQIVNPEIGKLSKLLSKRGETTTFQNIALYNFTRRSSCWKTLKGSFAIWPLLFRGQRSTSFSVLRTPRVNDPVFKELIPLQNQGICQDGTKYALMRILECRLAEFRST